MEPDGLSVELVDTAVGVTENLIRAMHQHLGAEELSRATGAIWEIVDPHGRWWLREHPVEGAAARAVSRGLVDRMADAAVVLAWLDFGRPGPSRDDDSWDRLTVSEAAARVRDDVLGALGDRALTLVLARAEMREPDPSNREALP